MKQFTFSDLNRVSGEILDAAMIEPVALTKRGKERLVILSADTYKRLLGNMQVDAYTLDNAPQDVIDELDAGLSAILSDEHA
jgi:prevent-host-death family protein